MKVYWRWLSKRRNVLCVLCALYRGELAKAASSDRVPFSLYQQVVMWCTMVALFSWIFKVFYSFRSCCCCCCREIYIPSQFLSWNNAIGRLLYPSWWCLVPLVRNDRFFFVTFLSLEASSVYLAKGQCIALFFSFTILVFTTSLPRVTPHPFVFFYIINIFL